MATAIVVGAVALGLVVAAIAGIVRSTQTDPLGRNGVIVYSVFENKDRAGQSSLTYQMDADGSNNRMITQGTCPTFSKDGTKLIYRSNWSETDLLIGPSDGSAAVTMPITLDFHYRDQSYALSPDGTQVAWFKPTQEISFPTSDGGSEGGTARNELWLTSVEGGPGVRLVPASRVSAESYGMLVWSPDGRRLAFEGRIAVPSSDGPSYRSAVYVVDVDQPELRRVTTRSAVSSYAFGLSWSPDSRYLAYMGLPDGSALPSIASTGPASDPPLDVFVIYADGTGDRNVTRSSTFESRPQWSPDGRRLAYLASETGEDYRLRVVPMDGPATAGSPAHGPASEAFTWSPDGNILLSVHANAVSSIDAGFQRPAATLVDVSSFPQTDPLHHAAYSTEGCSPSWQWLEP